MISSTDLTVIADAVQASTRGSDRKGGAEWSAEGAGADAGDDPDPGLKLPLNSKALPRLHIEIRSSPYALNGIELGFQDASPNVTLT